MKMTIVRPLVTNSKMTLLFLQGALSLPLSKRALVRWLSVREVRLRSLPSFFGYQPSK